MPIPKELPRHAAHGRSSGNKASHMTVEIETVSTIPSVATRPTSSHSRPATSSGDTFSNQRNQSSYHPKKTKFSTASVEDDSRQSSLVSSSPTSSSQPFIPQTPTHTRSYSPPRSTGFSSSKPGSSPKPGSLPGTSPFAFIPNPIDAAVQHYFPAPEVSPQAQHFADRVQAELDKNEAKKGQQKADGKITRNSSEESFIYDN